MFSGSLLTNERIFSKAHSSIIDDLKTAFGESILAVQPTRDDIPTLWVAREKIVDVLRNLQRSVDRPYRMLSDLTAVDERVRANRQDQPSGDYTVVYHLLSFERNEDVRVKVPLSGGNPSLPSITGLWPSYLVPLFTARGRP